MSEDTNLQHNYYYDKGWQNTQVGWYEVSVRTYNKAKHSELVNWLYDNIDNPERHVRWVKIEDMSHFRFRYEKDYIWFRLTW